jgi:hypothetical protein
LDTYMIQLCGEAVFLHNGNKFPSVSLAHVANMEESYDNIKQLFTIYYIQKFVRCFAKSPRVLCISSTSCFMTSLSSLGENALGFFGLMVCNFSRACL